MKKQKPTLQLIWNADAQQEIYSYRELCQLDLFDAHDRDRLVTTSLSKSDGTSFVDLLEDLLPRYVFDLRSCPRFDLMGYSRKQAFYDFQRLCARYIDRETLIERHGAGILVENDKIDGPILLIVDGDAGNSLDGVLSILPKADDGAWCIFQSFLQTNFRHAK